MLVGTLEYDPKVRVTSSCHKARAFLLMATYVVIYKPKFLACCIPNSYKPTTIRYIMPLFGRRRNHNTPLGIAGLLITVVNMVVSSIVKTLIILQPDTVSAVFPI